VQIDLKHLPRLKHVPAYVFVAIERATRFVHFVHIEIVTRRDAPTIAACLERFLQAFGHPVHTMLMCYGSEFTDRFAVDMKGKPPGKPSGAHPFDRLCAGQGIAHRLTRPFHPQINGMVERFNRRIAQAIAEAPPGTGNAGKNRFASPQQRTAYLLAFSTPTTAPGSDASTTSPPSRPSAIRRNTTPARGDGWAWRGERHSRGYPRAPLACAAK
jgi:transposase InsO family protein